VRLPAASDLLAVPGQDEQAVVDREPQAHRRRQVQREDRDLRDRGQDPEHQERPEDRDDPDRQGQSGGHHAAEHHDQQQHCDGDADPLGLLQIGLDLGADLVEDLCPAADADGERGVVDRVRGRQLLDAVTDRVVRAGDPRQDHRLVPVGAGQSSRVPQAPVRDDVRDPRLRGQP